MLVGADPAFLHRIINPNDDTKCPAPLARKLAACTGIPLEVWLFDDPVRPREAFAAFQKAA